MSRDIKYIGMDVHQEAISNRGPEWQWEAGDGNILETQKPAAFCSSFTVCGANCM